MTGWISFAGSGPNVSMRSSATSTAWTSRHQRKRRQGENDERPFVGPPDRARLPLSLGRGVQGVQVRRAREPHACALARRMARARRARDAGRGPTDRPRRRAVDAGPDPAQLREWAPFDAAGSLGTVGTRVKLTTVGAPTPHVTETTVTRADAPKVLEYNWGGFDMRWQLEAVGGATRLTLWTNIDRRFIAVGAPGRHLPFDVRDPLRNGTPLGRIVGPEAMKFAGWQRLHAEYAKQFGVS